MLSRFAIFFPFVLVAACSSNNSSTTTSSVSAKTVAGVCGKLDSLSCAQPNCVDKLTLIQNNCANQPSDFQALLDCMSVATLTCAGDPTIPHASGCDANVQSLALCATGTSGGTGVTNGNNVYDGGTVSTGSGSCNSVTDCTSWPCQCADGTGIDIASCTNGVCADPVRACGSASTALIEACKSHGGVN